MQGGEARLQILEFRTDVVNQAGNAVAQLRVGLLKGLPLLLEAVLNRREGCGRAHEEIPHKGAQLQESFFSRVRSRLKNLGRKLPNTRRLQHVTFSTREPHALQETPGLPRRRSDTCV